MADLPLIPDRGWLRRYVDLYVGMSEAPAEAHLATAMAILSAAVGWRAYIRWGESSEPCTLFVMLEGGSAVAKKTTTARTGVGLIRHALRGMDSSVLSVRSMSHASRRGVLELIGTTDDAKATAWDYQYPPGVVLDWDEFGSILGRPGDVKGADWLGQLRATIMELYSGRHGGIQTGDKRVLPSRCAVAILATMTRHELEQRVSTGLLRDGFMGRFILIPHPGRDRYLADPPAWTPVDAQRRDVLADQLRLIASSSQEVGDIFARHSPAAKELRRHWYEKRMRQLDNLALRGGEKEAAMVDAMSRLQTTAVKVAAIMAVSELEPGEGLGEAVIECRHVEYGVALAEHALREVSSLASDAGPAPDRYAMRVVDYLRRRNGEAPVRRKRLLDDVRMEGMDRERCWKIVQQLHKEGQVEIRLASTGGRPAEIVELAS